MEEISRPWPLDAPRPCAARTSCPPVLPPPLPTPGRSACTSFLIFSALRANARSVALLALQGEDVGKERLTASTGLASQERAGVSTASAQGQEGMPGEPQGPKTEPLDRKVGPAGSETEWESRKGLS